MPPRPPSGNWVSDVVKDRVDEGRRVAELLSSELTGREDPPFGQVAVTDPDTDVEPSPDGARAFDISVDGTRVAQVFVHPDRARLDLHARPAAAREALEATDLRWRPAGGGTPKVIVFLPDGVAVKRVLEVIGAVATSETP
jgi:hypothetical protein